MLLPKQEPSRAQAQKALGQPSAQTRFAAIVRLADIGTMADATRIALRLRDDAGRVRQVAGSGRRSHVANLARLGQQGHRLDIAG